MYPLRSRAEMSEPLPTLFDIGINLTHESYDADRAAVMERAASAGVTRMLVTGASLASSRDAIALAHLHPDTLRCTAGVHPHHASELDPDRRQELSGLARNKAVVAVGECGLDYFRDLSPREAQLEAFRSQLGLARQIRKPVFLHQREAHADFVAVLREFPGVRGVAHCFTDGVAEATAYLDLGLYIGITGWICDERRGQHLRDVVRMIPAERLLIETDGPYLLPRDMRPKPASRRNEPAYLPHILATIAAARSESIEVLASRTTQNAADLFGWPALESQH